MTAIDQPPLALRRRCADVLRGLAMDAVQQANSGHPGMPMGMADVAADVWLRHLRYDPADPAWLGRDRFVLSAGHGSMLLYGLLHLAGFDLGIADLQAFRQLHSRTPGHPEAFLTPGVETTTGPLGQGFGNAVGMALGLWIAAARLECPLLGAARVVGICSDGDLMEGISHEAASLAGHLGLGNLVFFWDDNRITIDGSTELTFTEDTAARFRALGWRVVTLDDGHDAARVAEAVDRAFTPSEQPTLVVCRTQIAFGSPNKQGSAKAHGAPLGADEVRAAKQRLGLPEDETFHVPDDVVAAFRAAAVEKQRAAEAWRAELGTWRAADAERSARFDAFWERRVPDDLYDHLREAAGVRDGATRVLSAAVIQRAAELVPSLLTGSADLDASCKTRITTSGAVRRGDFAQRNLHFGVREHAMGAIVNGLSLCGGHLPVGSTFLVFSDYMRPAVRLAALAGLPAVWVWTHDSLFVGEDGPTHQPVEQLAALRLIPHLHVWRPADGLEVAAAWTHALTRRNGPVALVLSRQDLPRLERPRRFDFEAVRRGGYVVWEPDLEAQGVVVATGSEVHVTIAAARQLESEHGLPLRVVTMPCLELFLAQERSWREAVLPPRLPTLAVELGRPEIWCQLTGSIDRVIGVQRFGESAPWQQLAEEFGFTPPAIAEQLRAMLA